jgi:xanthine dehydrogenase accessory factor
MEDWPLLFKDIRQTKVLIRGAGEQATGVAYRLHKSGFRVCMTEIAEPQAVRRTVSFCEAVYDGVKTVEEVTAVRITKPADISAEWEKKNIPLIIDPGNEVRTLLKPHVIVDAVLTKRNIGTEISDAPLVLGLGPGFIASLDVHVVIETNRGHDLGRLIFRGQAEPNTGVPGVIGGYGIERVLRTPRSGVFYIMKDIGDSVKAGDVVANVEGMPIQARIDGVIRGLLRDGIVVPEDFKAGDIDPRGNRDACFTISDKARALGGAVLEAILSQLPARIF